MLNYTLKRESNGSVTIDITMVFDKVDDAITAIAEIEKLTVGSGIDGELLPFMKEGRHLEAVKHYKDEMDVGLKEAKEYCDILRDKFRAMGLVPNN